MLPGELHMGQAHSYRRRTGSTGELWVVSRGAVPRPGRVLAVRRALARAAVPGCRVLCCAVVQHQQYSTPSTLQVQEQVARCSAWPCRTHTDRKEGRFF